MAKSNHQKSDLLFFEEQKNQFLAALYTKDFTSAEHCYHSILQAVKNNHGLSENEEKQLRQVQQAFKVFRSEILNHLSLKIGDDYKLLQKLILTHVKKTAAAPGRVDYSAWIKKSNLTNEQAKAVFKTAITFQLTSGCSNYCRRCNEWALPKVRTHFTFDAAIKILNNLAEQNNLDLSLYGASDPLDWEDEDKNLFDLLTHTRQWKASANFSLLTKIPKGKKEILKQIISNNFNIAVSQTAKNKSRIAKLEELLPDKIAKQHELEELLIPAGLDENFSSVKPSITDAYGTEITPEGAFIIIPTFTSGLYPFGHKKIPITQDTSLFPVKKTGRKALLVDYFTPLHVYDLSERSFYLDHLWDIQVETLLLDNGKDELTPPGMRSIKEYFDIFEDKARGKRKQMTPSVFRRLKKQFLSKNSFARLPQAQKVLYLLHIKNHLDFCKKERVFSAKIFAVSFLLEAVVRYLKKNSLKQQIISFLLNNELTRTCDNPNHSLYIKSTLKTLLKRKDLNTFDIFRFFTLQMIKKKNLRTVKKFISSNKAKFDPVSQRFIPDLNVS
ncbi:MAG: hypothetical protein GY729_05390 [Desulfobacteraceae bacterium]|nr:hypothetical protein [Desulfobacteraceae bacterium]